MDSATFSRIGSSLKQIKSVLAQDEQLRKLLILDNPNIGTTTITQARDHIFIQPVIDVEVKPPFNKPCFITLTIPETGRSGNIAMSVIFRVSIFADKEKWIYNTDNLRVFEIIERITALLDRAVLPVAGPLQFDSIVETIIDKQVYGYSVLFLSTDGIGVIHDNQ